MTGICPICGGELRKGHTEMRVRVGDGLLVIKNIPAGVCKCCEEALITPETPDKIEQVLADFRAGRLLAKPLASGEIALECV